MKIVFQLLIFMLPFSLMGQDPDLMPLEEGVENLDFSEVSSGLLWDISPQLIGLDLLDGQSIDETNRMTINTYGMAYATISGAAVNDSYLLPTPDGYMDAIESLSNGSPIPITVSAFNYHQMKPTALDDGLFTVSAGKLYDAPNRPETPYEEKIAFFASALTNISFSPTMSFVIPSDLYLTNFPNAVNGIEINLGDGNGFQTSAFDTPIDANFGDFTGQKEIAIRFTYTDGTVLLAHTILHVVEIPEEDTGVDFRYDFDPVDSIVVSGGKGYIFSLCGGTDNKIRKPFFFVEGFNPDLPDVEDFDNQTFRHMRNQLNQFLTVNGVSINLFNVLEDEGYDLIYVDYADPTASIQDNAAVLTAIINDANAQKAANNSIEKNVVFGESMGGLVSKYALLNMENNSIDHETETLMTFDSPLRGANIPLSMQQLVDDLYRMKVNALFGVLSWKLRDFVPQIKELGNLIKTPAVKQMLINHIEHDSANNNEHESLMTEIENFGQPQDFEMFAISNGSVTGIGQLQVDGMTALMPGDKIVGIDINSGDIGTIINEFWNGEIPGGEELGVGEISFNPQATANIVTFISKVDKLLPLLLGIKLKFNTNLYAMKTFDEKIYDFKMDIRLFGFLAYAKGRNEMNADPSRFKLIPLDNAPGGINGTTPPSGDIFDFAVDEGFLEINATTFCFIPTVSALDIKSPDNEVLFQNLLDEQATLDAELTVVDRYIGSPNAAETSYGVAQNNQRHVVFTNINARLFVLGLSSGNALSGLSNINNRIFNFGESDFTQNLTVPFRRTSNTINYDLNIINSGGLWVNRLDKIGFIDNVNNAENSNPTHFDLYVRPDYCDDDDEILIRVGNDSEIILGEWVAGSENTANLYLSDKVTMRVQNSGRLNIGQNSKFIIQSGAEVIIESGGLLDCSWNAQVIVEAGGILRVENNGQLRPSNNGQIWVQPGGQLILDGGAKVQLWAGGGQNAIEDAPCNIKLGGPILDPDNTPDVAELVLNGQFDYSGTGYFDIHPNSNIELVGDTNFEIDGYAKGYRFLKLSDGAHLNISKNQCRLRNGEIEYSASSQIDLTDEAAGRFSQIEFTGHPNSTGISAEKARFVFVSGSNFSNFEVAISAQALTDYYLTKVSH